MLYPMCEKSSIMKTISQDKSPQQILSIGESSIYPRRAQYRFWSYDQALPMSYHTIYFISLIFALIQIVAEV